MKNNIRELREALGWSQSDLGEAVGVTRQAVLAIEKDKHDPSIRLAARLAAALGVTLAEAFDLTDTGGRGTRRSALTSSVGASSSTYSETNSTV